MTHEGFQPPLENWNVRSPLAEESVVIRGGKLETDNWMLAIERDYRAMGQWELSVWADNPHRGETLQDTVERLISDPTTVVPNNRVCVARYADLESEGFLLTPSEPAPYHYIVVFDALPKATDLNRLAARFEEIENPVDRALRVPRK